STASSELEVSDTATATANLRLEISAVDERVVVSASLVGALAPEIGSSVSVVDQAEIKDRGAESVLDVLRGVPGVEVNQTGRRGGATGVLDRKSTRLNSSHEWLSYAVFCLKKRKTT